MTFQIKPIILFAYGIFFSSLIFSQSLEGEWKGSFFTNTEFVSMRAIASPIKLYFKPYDDSLYNVYSYSRGFDARDRDTIIVCKVNYRFIGKDSLYLEEVEILKPKKAKPTCFQKMYLKLSKEGEILILSGTWKSDDKICSSDGTISFKKQ